ncbi:MAG: hypothetical protein MHPSP_000065 [Paramarteilia canceri]
MTRTKREENNFFAFFNGICLYKVDRECKLDSPPGWIRSSDDKGNIYLHAATGKVQREFPIASGIQAFVNTNFELKSTIPKKWQEFANSHVIVKNLSFSSMDKPLVTSNDSDYDIWVKHFFNNKKSMIELGPSDYAFSVAHSGKNETELVLELSSNEINVLNPFNNGFIEKSIRLRDIIKFRPKSPKKMKYAIFYIDKGTDHKFCCILLVHGIKSLAAFFDRIEQKIKSFSKLVRVDSDSVDIVEEK